MPNARKDYPVADTSANEGVDGKPPPTWEVGKATQRNADAPQDEQDDG